MRPAAPAAKTIKLLCAALSIAAFAACALVADLGDVTLGDVNAAVDSGGRDSQSTRDVSNDQSLPINDAGVELDANADADAAKPSVTGFEYTRTIAITSDAPAPLANHAVLVVLPTTFDYAHAKANGDDIRFSLNDKHEDDLVYFIEKYTPGGESLIWVRVPAVATGASQLHMFYGRDDAPAISDFASTFPNAQRTPGIAADAGADSGTDAGTITATGDIDVDWFELRAGDTLALTPKAPLKITARRIIIAGLIDGDGKGDLAGVVPNGIGEGPGGGQASVDDAPGGGGFGGAGGRGGTDDGGVPASGGSAHGNPTTDDVALGSGGGSALDHAGGAGGGALTLIGWKTTVTGTIRMNGVDGVFAGDGSGRGGGGGSGGSVLIASCFLELATGTLLANGGAGGACAISANDGGGGGGGGRIKLRRRANGSFTAPATLSATFGLGGAGGGTAAPGENGLAGTTDIQEASTLVKGAEVTVGAETPAP